MSGDEHRAVGCRVRSKAGGPRFNWPGNLIVSGHSPVSGSPRRRGRGLGELAAGSKSPEWATLITFAALTGMRRGELCGLRWTDVEWAGGAINVRRSIWQTKDGWGEKDPKSHQVRRLVLGEQTMGVLTGRYKRVSDNVALAEISLSPDAYVFSPGLDGSKPMLPGAVTLAFRRLCNTMAEQTGDEWPYRFHDLRHYTATRPACWAARAASTPLHTQSSAPRPVRGAAHERLLHRTARPKTQPGRPLR